MSDTIEDKLITGSETLNQVVKIYFIPTARLNDVIIGNFSFKDVYHDFTYSLREYSITHSMKIEPQESPSCRQLLKLNDICIQHFRELVIKVNRLLESYTSTNLNDLENQLINFLDSLPCAPDFAVSKVQDKIYDTPQREKSRYLDSIIIAMKEAEVNQILDEKYLVIDRALNLYSQFLSNWKRPDFKDKQKYLAKSSADKKVKLLKKYVKEMLENDENKTDDERINTVRWFFIYLIYGSSKIDIFMIHSILGYKYKGAVKLYQKLFLKDHSTGKNNDFLHHTNFLYINKENLVNDREVSKFVYTPENLKKLKQWVKRNKYLSYERKDDKLIIYNSSECYEKQIYKQIIHDL